MAMRKGRPTRPARRRDAAASRAQQAADRRHHRDFGRGAGRRDEAPIAVSSCEKKSWIENAGPRCRYRGSTPLRGVTDAVRQKKKHARAQIRDPWRWADGGTLLARARRLHARRSPSVRATQGTVAGARLRRRPTMFAAWPRRRVVDASRDHGAGARSSRATSDIIGRRCAARVAAVRLNHRW